MRRPGNGPDGKLSLRGLPIVCIDARQAHAVLSQMHNKADKNDAGRACSYRVLQTH
ncbi:transposase [Ochrobactrum sp. P6BSIII]|nr:transposase [Ochrobactrum sp. P6BSIII]